MNSACGLSGDLAWPINCANMDSRCQCWVGNEIIRASGFKQLKWFISVMQFREYGLLRVLTRYFIEVCGVRQLNLLTNGSAVCFSHLYT